MREEYVVKNVKVHHRLNMGLSMSPNVPQKPVLASEHLKAHDEGGGTLQG